MDESLDQLVAQCLDRMEQGCDAATAVSEVCEPHPTTVQAVTRRLELLRQVGVLAFGEPQAPMEQLEQLGGFRLLHLIGGGGMGLVYLAEQEQLGRQVALKIIRPGHLHFADMRRRFKREVETIARLQHPGIVPVYEVGETHGVPWFAMEHVRGATLEQVLRDLGPGDPRELTAKDLARAVARCSKSAESSESADDSVDPPDPSGSQRMSTGSWADACLHVTQQIAEALGHVHQRGVVHRDIKPSNVMLSLDGRAMLLDFGLASAEGSASITTTGAQLGSMLYMSPEQARGDTAALGPATDIYSLGATLFELLTLRPAFEEGSATSLTVAIQQGVSTGPRAHHSGLSRDAEIVCLRAMDRDPTRRYGSAAELAQDISNVLERRPINARPATLVLRTARWIERHRVAAVALGLGLLMTLVGLTLFAVSEQRHDLELAEEQETTQLAVDRSVDAVRRLTQWFDNEFAFVALPEAARARILNEALELLEQQMAEQGDQPAMQLEAARLSCQLARFFDLAGRAQEGLAACAQAAALLEGQPEQTVDVLVGLAEMHGTVADCLRSLGRFDEALESLAQAVFQRQQALLEVPDDPKLSTNLAKLWIEIAIGLRQSSLSDAEAAVRQAISLVTPFVDDFDVAGTTAASARNVLAVVLWRSGRVEQAEASCRSGIDWFDKAVGGRSLTVGERAELASLLYNQALMLSDLGREEQSRKQVMRSKEIIAQLVSAVPDRLGYRLTLAQTCNVLGNSFFEDGFLDQAQGEHDQGRAVLRELVADHSENPAYGHELATMLVNGAVIARLTHPEAPLSVRQSADEAELLLRPLVQALPGVPEYTALLGQALGNRGWALLAEDSWSQARQVLEESVQCLAAALAIQPGHPNYRTLLAEQQIWLREALLALGDGPALAALEAQISAMASAADGDAAFVR